MTNPFVDISVQPAYGRHEGLVRWKVAVGFELGSFYVYRSVGGGRWQLLNPDTPVCDGSAAFLDTNLLLNWRDDRLEYRLMLEMPDGRRYDSPIVGAFDKLTRSEFAIVRRIMELELLRMDRGRNGIEVLVFKPLFAGTLCSCVDPDTRQSTQSSVCEECYGTHYKGGYAAPLRTFCEHQQWSPHAPDDRPDGSGSADPRMTKSRFLAWPPLNQGDLIVHRPSDQRFAVATTQPQYFRGLVPVVLDTELLLLPKKDIRYKVPMPL